jgi:DNA repair protein RadC
MSDVNKNIPIKQWAADDRPREKAMLKGLESVSNAELIAILIGNGTTNKSALDLAKELLQLHQNNLDTLARKSIAQLSKCVKGIGAAKACSILVALELGRRKTHESVLDKNTFVYPRDFAGLLTPLMGDKTVEEFYIVFLTNSNRLLGIEKISIGGSKSTIVDVKVILKRILETEATKVVVAHNHPSGSLVPSPQDHSITQRLKAGCDAIDILLTDHMIITNNGYYSFADEGNLL